jgi:hypothetical protein
MIGFFVFLFSVHFDFSEIIGGLAWFCHVGEASFRIADDDVFQNGAGGAKKVGLWLHDYTGKIFVSIALEIRTLYIRLAIR